MSAGELRLRCRLVSLMSGKLRYPMQVYAGLLFRLPLAITSFNWFPDCWKRWLAYCQVLTSLYFDAAITDVRSAKGSGQWAMKQLCLMIGSLFAEDKTQTMQSTGAFLGLTHDLSCINKTGHVRFLGPHQTPWQSSWCLATARQAGHFTRGTASKLYGLAIFLEQGISGRVGYGGLMAIKARNWSSLWCCAPWSSAPTFFDIDMVSGSSTTLPQSWPWWEGALAIRG